jgi:hypothetical protein
MTDVVASHSGTVVFENGRYVRQSGTSNWKVMPIAGFDPPIRVPVGQVQIEFDPPIAGGYSVLVTPLRVANTPQLSANYGNAEPNGFVVHLWETIADRTLQNGSFSFVVFQNATGPQKPSGGESMEVKTLLKIQLDSGQVLLAKAADTLTESEFHNQLPGPGPSAHWIFGHLTVNEDWFLSLLTGQPVRSPKDLIDRYQDDASFTKESTDFRGTSDSPLSKGAIVGLFLEQRQRTLAELATTDLSRWNEPLPADIPAMFRNLGGVWGIVATHPYWHLGQLMSIRHMLHKPPLVF